MAAMPWREYACCSLLIVSCFDILSCYAQASKGGTFITRRVNTESVANLASELSQNFAKIKCDIIKAGIKCKTLGMQQRLQEVAKNIYSTQGNLHIR